MATLQVSEAALAAAGFSKPAQANTFYPAGNQDTHIHLGVPTVHDQKFADPGHRFVTYVSIKVDDAFYANLTKSGITGKFNPDIGKPWPAGLREPLTALGLLKT